MESLRDGQLISRKHVDLLSAVSQLDAKQRVTSPTRRELNFQVSEFDLSHPEREAAQENKLMKTVWVKQRFGENDALNKTLKFAHQKLKTLKHPLQGPTVTKIQRSIGYQNVKKRLNSWNTIVRSNRNAEHLKFPWNQSSVSFQTTDDVISKWKSQTQTPLEKEISAILNGSSAKQDEQEEKRYKLDVKELAQYRREMARLRALHSYMAAKAKRQKKIKSKRYHRILRNERTKKQLKEFETLQKMNPEAALKQLEKLEYARVEERATLRHRNTGKWAHNKAVRAKYDSESRKELVQQLEISRELTHKNKMGDSSEDENDDDDEKTRKYKHEISFNDDNPWVGMQAVPKVSNYRKYWQQRNHSMEKGNEEVLTSFHEVSNSTEQHRQDDNGMTNTHSLKQSAISVSKGTGKNFLIETVNIEMPESQRNVFNSNVSNNSKKSALVNTASGSWVISPTTDNVSRGGNISNQLQQQFKMKAFRQSNNSESFPFIGIGSEAPAVDSDKEEIGSLACKSKALALMDEGLIEEAQGKVINKDMKPDNTDKAFGHSEGETDDIKEYGKYTDVDPDKVIMMKPKYLLTQLPAEISNGEENLDDVNKESDEENQKNITEAFTEDDVIAEFRKEKEEMLEKCQPADIDLSLPGWGEWTGKGIKCSRKKKRTFVIKAPRLKPKYSNKGNIIINDKKDGKLQQHQVNELPPAFISVKDFEASIRAPLGNTWLPQTAHHKLSATSVVTKLGSTIKPLDQDVLLNYTKLNIMQHA